MLLSSFVRTSDILAELLHQAGRRLTLADVIRTLKHRSFAFLTVLLGLPNCLPMPPPIPLICGLLLFFVAIQMAWGQKMPWVPRRIRYKYINKEHARVGLNRAIPLFQRLERWCRPRFAFMQTDWAIRVIGILLCVLSLTLIVAFPFIGQIPIGFSICVIGLGLVERDGMAIIVGAILGILVASLTIFFNYAIIAWVLNLIGL